MVDLKSTALLGVEALIRWNHPRRGLLMPGEFIGVAEDSGLIVPMGEWVLTEACRQAVAWQRERSVAEKNNPALAMSVNVSAHQLLDPTFPGRVATVIDGSGIDPDCLWLEITESALMSNKEHAATTLQHLRDLGLHLVIDDFGTGYSSLSRLKRFPVEAVKIDRTFIADLDTNGDAVAIAKAIIALGESLHLSVIAEGIERTAQAKLLVELGCNLGQGYLYGRPVPAHLIESLLAEDLGNRKIAVNSSDSLINETVVLVSALTS